MKRFVCFLLALVMVLGLIPMTATTANAYSTRNVSNKAIDILSGSMTFHAKETGNKIGYGTPTNNPNFNVDKYLNSINKDAAIDLMHDYINEIVDEKINAWAKSNNIDLSQNEHDALAVNIYREANTNVVFEAIRTIKTVNSAADRLAMVEAFAASRSHNASGAEDLKITLDISLAEAAMYLYGSYGYDGGSNLVYTMLDTNGDMKSDDFAAFVKNDGYSLPLVSGSLGWFLYDSKEEDITGAPLTKLTKDHAGKLIVAKKATGGNDAAEYTINTSTLSDLNVYSYGSTPVKTDVQLKNNTKFYVSYEYLDGDGVKWVFGTGTNTKGKEAKGWIKVGKLQAGETLPEKPIATATVTSATLNVRPGATAVGNTPIDTLNKGEVVNVYEIKVEKTETGNQNWGKIQLDDGTIGWINLAYADVNETTGESGEAKGQTGKIANTDTVNIRAAAGTDKARITGLDRGTKVTVLETEMVGTAQWGKIKWSNPSDGYTEGWVYMHYVQLDSAPAGSGSTDNGTVLYTGIVTSNINLNVRRRADVYSTKVDSLPNGTKVNIYETATKNNMKWGRIGTDRWVCLAYVSLTEVKQPEGGSSATTTTLQATVTAATLDVLKNYNSNAAKVGSLKKGDVVTILEKNTETTQTGSRIWGRIAKDGVEGWINLAYVELKTVTSVNGTTSGSTTGTTNANGANAVISNCISVNVREGAGVSNAQITKLNNGTAVKVYEQVTKDNAPWARITWNNGANSGWVCMNYVTMNNGTIGSTTEGGLVNGTNSNTISATGIVNSNIDLNVRSIAGLNGIKLGSLKKGTKVTVFEQVSADGMIWGRIQYGNGSGWICMSYISIESASSTGKGVMGTIARCFAAVNVRSAPGTGNALINKIAVGTRVEVFETREYSGQLWGRVAQGWICMDYVLLDSELPPGTVLDATEPTTEATDADDNDATVNRDGEIAFKIEAITLQDLNVRNDTSVNSDRVGTVKANMPVDIRAVKNNGAEVWGRIDQYGTAGWILMDSANVTYKFANMYVIVDEQPIYTDADVNSTVKGSLPINTKLDITTVTTDGTNVYGWVEEGIFGWIPMNKLSTSPVDVIPTYKSGDSVGDPAYAVLTGRTFASMNAYDSVGGSKILFKVTSGVTVNVEEVVCEYGKVYGLVYDPSAEYGHAWLDLGNVSYTLTGIIKNTTELNVRSSMDATSTADDEPNNIIKALPQGTSLQICQLAFDGNGNLWARINNNSDTEINGAFVMVMTSGKTVYVESAALGGLT